MDHHPLTDSDWEAAWAPYDEATYRAALAFLRPDDVVLDIGAGDLRFARRAAALVRRVVAVERNAALFPFSTQPQTTCEGVLIVLQGDALAVDFPPDVTVGVLLMRHCRHFAHYIARLRGVGCRQLITNARWGMGVECVSLAPQPSFAASGPGWYACLCGAVGFKPGPPESITPIVLQRVHALENCPACCTGSHLAEMESTWSESSSSLTAPN
ncbi:MAG: hypothetical protein A2W37_07400 [Chloroflexi bacterium RBG_16_63_12]|jgi:hypothetical protein|nr:MAG: hypothetical protein A2W37_07400 [Chloroflexi bacterium RBG_16_63_12]